jgi:pyruvate kinase
MDLPGNKVRTKDLPNNGIELVKGEQFTIPNECFNYPEFHRHLKPGMTTWANDSVFEFEVVAADDEKITFLSKSDGVLINGKGVHARGIHTDIPFLFEKDKQLIQVANKYRLEYVGLSFVRSAENVKEAKALLADNIKVISKIETLDAVDDINNILPLVEYILVDRGDLSTDIGILNIPRYQKFIIEKAQYYDVKVFLATQVLKNMESKPLPTIGEVEALYEIYKSGVYGVQMSEETAVGKYVKETVGVLNDMFATVEKEKIG